MGSRPVLRPVGRRDHAERRGRRSLGLGGEVGDQGRSGGIVPKSRACRRRHLRGGGESFQWGSGQSSRLSFSSEAFNPEPNEPFSLGRIDYFNGEIDAGTGATSVDLQLDIGFDNASENDTRETVSFSLINTPNSDDPEASADFVSFTFGNRTSTFNVLEGLMASAELVGIFRSGGFEASTVENQTGKSSAAPLDFPAISLLDLEVLGFREPSGSGFVTTSAIPLPAAALLLLTALAALGAGRRRG